MAALVSSALDAWDLVKSYAGRRVVEVEHLAVEEGEVLAVLGPNGAGKSTLFRLLSLLEPAEAGRIAHFGRPVKSGDLAARRRTATVFQRPLLMQGNVRENVAFGLKLRRVARDDRREKVAWALDLMGIAGFADADVKTLSGGELQRVAIARALVLDPEILFLDEPTSNLDGGVRRRFREDLRDVVGRLGVTVVLITHDQNEALSLAHRVAVLREGRVVQEGSTDDVFARPSDSFVADFMGVETVWHGRVTACADGLCTVLARNGHTAEAVASVPTAEGDTVLLAMRPEDIALTPLHEGGWVGGAAPTSVRNHWHGVVEDVTHAGPLVRVRIVLSATGPGRAVPAEPAGPGVAPAEAAGYSLGPALSAPDPRESRLIALITRPSAESLGIAPGVEVEAAIKATALHMMEG